MTDAQRIGFFLILFGALAAIVVVTGGPCQYLPSSIRFHGDFQVAERDITRIEGIRRETGAYPDQEFRASSPKIAYRPTVSGFKLLLEEGMDTWFVYDSSTREWIENGSFAARAQHRDVKD